MSCQNILEFDSNRQPSPDRPEKMLQLSEADHRAANSFTLLAATLSNQARELARQPGSMSKKEVAALLDEVGSRITGIGQLHRDIAALSGSEALDLNQHLHTLCESLVSGLATQGQFTVLQNTGRPCMVSTRKVLPINLIVTEIVTNSLKYAHPAGVHGVLAVGCEREPGGSILIEVSDDGVGLPAGFDPERQGGIGSRTIGVLARQLRGEVAYISGPLGLRVRLRLPATVAD